MLIRSAIVVTALLVFAPAASADTMLAPWVDPAGDPVIETSPAWALLPGVEIRECPPDGAPCVAIPTVRSQRGGPVAAYPGETAPGTVFEVVYDRSGTEVVERTPVWTGRETFAAPPAITGDAVVGGRVQLHRARRDGGWATPLLTESHLLVCPTPTGGECWAIDGKLEDRWAGQYLLLTENRYPTGALRSAGMTLLPYVVPGVDVAKPGFFGMFSAPVQIRPAPTPPPAPPAVTTTVVEPQKPMVTLRKRALRSKGKILVGRVTCPERCEVTLRVGGTITRFTAQGTRALKAPARRGKLHVRVYVNGQLIESARVQTR